MKLVLASGSPRRRQLLGELGWNFIVEPSALKESRVPGESPENMVCRLAETKAADVFSRNRDAFVIGADTVVAIDGRALGKPADEDEAVRMIEMLQGRVHTVMTGVAVLAPDGRKLLSCEKTDVTFRKLSHEEAIAYVAQGESLDKAGAYAIQEKGTLLVESIRGCYFNVVGLPLEALSKMLAELGWTLAEQWRVNR